MLVVVWCLTPHSTIFQLYRGGSVLLVEETGVPEENHRPIEGETESNTITLV